MVYNYLHQVSMKNLFVNVFRWFLLHWNYAMNFNFKKNNSHALFEEFTNLRNLQEAFACIFKINLRRKEQSETNIAVLMIRLTYIKHQYTHTWNNIMRKMK